MKRILLVLGFGDIVLSYLMFNYIDMLIFVEVTNHLWHLVQHYPRLNGSFPFMPRLPKRVRTPVTGTGCQDNVEFKNAGHNSLGFRPRSYFIFFFAFRASDLYFCSVEVRTSPLHVYEGYMSVQSHH